MTDDREGFVPVGALTLEALVTSVRTAKDAERTLATAAEALLELTAEMTVDAVRGLRARGATSAQVERYEDAHRQAAAQLREGIGGLATALEELESNVKALD